MADRTDSGDLLRVALAASKAEGCDCDPDIDVKGEWPIFHAAVGHDDCCALLRRRAARWN